MGEGSVLSRFGVMVVLMILGIGVLFVFGDFFGEGS